MFILRTQAWKTVKFKNILSLQPNLIKGENWTLIIGAVHKITENVWRLIFFGVVSLRAGNKNTNSKSTKKLFVQQQKGIQFCFTKAIKGCRFGIRKHNGSFILFGENEGDVSHQKLWKCIVPILILLPKKISKTTNVMNFRN